MCQDHTRLLLLVGAIQATTVVILWRNAPFAMPGDQRQEVPCSAVAILAANWEGAYYEPITFVTVPRPQRRARNINMSILTLCVWLSFPFSRVIMASDERVYDPEERVMPIVRSIYGGDRVQFTGELPTGYDGRPMIREWFKAGMRHTQAGYVCFLNGDILVDRQWLKTAYRVFQSMRPVSNKTMILGVRTDVTDGPWVSSISVRDVSFMEKLEGLIRQQKGTDNPCGMDLAMVHSSFNALNWDSLPAFVIGLCTWDNFFISWAHRSCDLVFFNFQTQLWHISHQKNACNKTNVEFLLSMANQGGIPGWNQRPTLAKWYLDLTRNILSDWRSNRWINLSVIERKWIPVRPVPYTGIV